MINKSYRKSGYFGSLKIDSKKLTNKIKYKIRQVDKYGSELCEEVCKIFVEEARQRLRDSGYDVDRLLKNIFYREYGNGKFRVGIRNNKEKEIMYFLEFGTGIVGLDNPHPLANEVTWEYIVNPETLASNSGYVKNLLPTGYNSLGEYVGFDGWYYENPRDNQLCFTSGLKAVSYLYDTMQKDNMKKIIQIAKQRVFNRYVSSVVKTF